MIDQLKYLIGFIINIAVPSHRFGITILANLYNKRIMKNIRNYPEFTHFACLPFTLPAHRQTLTNIQQHIHQIVSPHYHPICFAQSNYNLAHVTICMLILHRQDVRAKAKEVITQINEQLASLLQSTVLTFSKINYFTRMNPKTKKKEVTLMYMQLQKDKQLQKVIKACDMVIRAMLKAQVIANNELKQMKIVYDHNQNLFKAEELHLSLYRVKDVVEDQKFLQLLKQISQKYEPVRFDCLSLDISTRNNYDQNNFYQPFEQVRLIKKQ